MPLRLIAACMVSQTWVVRFAAFLRRGGGGSDGPCTCNLLVLTLGVLSVLGPKQWVLAILGQKSKYLKQTPHVEDPFLRALDVRGVSTAKSDQE